MSKLDKGDVCVDDGRRSFLAGAGAAMLAAACGDVPRSLEPDSGSRTDVADAGSIEDCTKVNKVKASTEELIAEIEAVLDSGEKCVVPNTTFGLVFPDTYTDDTEFYDTHGHAIPPKVDKAVDVVAYIDPETGKLAAFRQRRTGGGQTEVQAILRDVVDPEVGEDGVLGPFKATKGFGMVSAGSLFEGFHSDGPYVSYVRLSDGYDDVSKQVGGGFLLNDDAVSSQGDQCERYQRYVSDEADCPVENCEDWIEEVRQRIEAGLQ